MRFRIVSNGRRWALLVGVLAGLATSGGFPALAVSSAIVATGRPITSVTFVGHGDGPGIGMGQWGAFGYAVRYHLSYEQILDHFYGNTKMATLSGSPIQANSTVSVVILENVNAKGTTGFDPVVTSPSAFTVLNGAVTPPTTTSTTTSTTTTTTSSTTTTSTSTTLPGTSSTTTSTTVPASSTTVSSTIPPTTSTIPTGGGVSIPAGMAVDLRLTASGTWNAYEAASCTAARQAVASAAPVATGLTNPTVVPAGPGPDAAPPTLLTLCRHDGLDETVRGDVEAYDRLGYERTLNIVPLQAYLEAVVPAEESPSWGTVGGTTGAPQSRAWGFQALEAQAVAARSYVVASIAAGGWNGYASICDTDQCQAYVGANFEAPLTDAAVSATLGEIRISSRAGAVIDARYSASTGGWTAPSTFPAVLDRGDACIAPAIAFECNPNHTWRLTVKGAVLSRRFRGLGRITRITVSARNRRGSLGGRVITVEVTGQHRTALITGSQFAALAGLNSDWFAVATVQS